MYDSSLVFAVLEYYIFFEVAYQEVILLLDAVY